MTALLGRFTKQPGEILDYDVDFEQFFEGRDDVPESHTATAETGITVVSSSLSGFVVKVTLSGGTHGTKYKVTVTLTTTAGLVKEVDFVVTIKAV